MLKPSRETSRGAMEGFFFFIFVAQVEPALGAPCQKVRLNKIDRAAGDDRRVFASDRKTPSVSEPILVAPIQRDSKFLLGAVADTETEFAGRFFTNLNFHGNHRRSSSAFLRVYSQRAEQVECQDLLS